MWTIDPATGKSCIRKRRKRVDEPGHARELTFSCYKYFPFLNRDRARLWFVEALLKARQRFSVDLWAYVIMPEHVHLLLYPRDRNLEVGRVVGAIKEAVARNAIRYLEEHAPQWLSRITVREGKKWRRRFWQPGGGYDRNVTEAATLRKMIDYIHSNPVRRGLVKRPEDWHWSSAGWYAGIRPVPIEIDATIPAIYETAGSERAQ